MKAQQWAIKGEYMKYLLILTVLFSSLSFAQDLEEVQTTENQKIELEKLKDESYDRSIQE